MNESDKHRPPSRLRVLPQHGLKLTRGREARAGCRPHLRVSKLQKMMPNHPVGKFSQGRYFNQRNGERGREREKKRGSPHSQAYTFSHVLGQRTIIASFTDIKKEKKKSIPQNMTKMLPVISSRDEKSAITKSLI